MLATTFAANALSVPVPLAGPELGTAFTFRRFIRQGADAPLAGWSLLGGMASAAAGAAVVAGGGLSLGNILAALVAVAAAVLVWAALAAVITAARWPWMRRAVERPAAWTLQHGSRLFRRPAEDPGRVIRSWVDRLGSLRLSPSGWGNGDRPGPGELARRRGRLHADAIAAFLRAGSGRPAIMT